MESQERDEFRFARPLNRSPFIPAKAGIQGRELGQRTGSPLPRGRTELRGNSTSSHPAQGFVGRLRWVATVLAGAAAMALSRGHVAAQSPQQVQQLADQTIRRLDLQTSFPGVPEPIRFTLPSEVLWIVIGLALVVMLYAFRDLIPILRSGQGS